MYKILVNAQKCNYSETSGLKGQQTLTALSFSLCSAVLLREVILAQWTSKWVSASAYERCPLTRGVHLQEVKNAEL